MEALAMTRRLEVVVVGGGYAGVLAANRAAGKGGDAVDVTLVSDRDVFVDRVRLHEVATGTHDARHPLDTLLSPRVRRVRGRVIRVDAAQRRLILEGAPQSVEASLPYDQLVFAVGSGPARGLPGAREHAFALADADEARRVAARFAQLRDGARCVVVGGGLTGIELAAEFRCARPTLEVVLLTDAFAPDWDASTRDVARARLGQLGVRLAEGRRVAAFEAGGVRLVDGTLEAAALVVETAGFSIPTLARDSGLPVDPAGRLLVDEYLRVLGVPYIMGIGDAVSAPLACVGNGVRPMRMACATAMPMAAHAGDAVARIAHGRTLLPFRYSNTVQCVSLGRDDGMLVFIDADDRPTGRVLVGALGAFAKRVICAGVLGTLRVERVVPGVYVWPGWGRSRRLGREADQAVAQLPGESSAP